MRNFCLISSIISTNGRDTMHFLDTVEGFMVRCRFGQRDLSCVKMRITYHRNKLRRWCRDRFDNFFTSFARVTISVFETFQIWFLVIKRSYVKMSFEFLVSNYCRWIHFHQDLFAEDKRRWKRKKIFVENYWGRKTANEYMYVRLGHWFMSRKLRAASLQVLGGSSPK